MNSWLYDLDIIVVTSGGGEGSMHYGMYLKEVCIMGCIGRKYASWDVLEGNMHYGMYANVVCIMGCIVMKYVLLDVL